MAHEVETNPVRLRQLADRAKRLAAAAAEYEQRAKEVEMDDGASQ